MSTQSQRHAVGVKLGRFATVMLLVAGSACGLQALMGGDGGVGGNDKPGSKPDPTTPVTAITVNAPNGGETLNVGSLFSITWQAPADTQAVRIEWSPDQGLNWLIVNA